MKNLITRLREVRTLEEAFTLAEVMVAIFLLGMVAMVVIPIASMAQASQEMMDKQLGQNQGDVMDTAREITDVAFLWVATHAEAGLDTTFTKSDIVSFNECDRRTILGSSTAGCDAEPFLKPIPETYVWGAGNQYGSLHNICAVVYEESPAEGSDNSNYTADSPALWERMAKNHTHLNACTSTDEDGNINYNFGEVSIPNPYGTAKTQVLGGGA